MFWEETNCLPKLPVKIFPTSKSRSLSFRKYFKYRTSDFVPCFRNSIQQNFQKLQKLNILYDNWSPHSKNLNGGFFHHCCNRYKFLEVFQKKHLQNFFFRWKFDSRTMWEVQLVKIYPILKTRCPQKLPVVDRRSEIRNSINSRQFLDCREWMD